jgi:hypothetical protein
MRRVTLMAIVVVGLGLTGCAMPEDAELAQGLTVLDAEDTSLAAAFRQGDAVVFLEVVRGHATPDVYQQHEGSPRFEVDARFVADDGHVFYSQRGGDSWVDSAWAADLAEQAFAPTGSNEALFDMAAAAVAVLDIEVENQLGSDHAMVLAAELDAVRSIGAAAPATYAIHKQRVLKHQQEIAYGGPGGEDDWASQSGGYFAMEVHADTIDWTFGLGWHSATRLFKWNDGWVSVHDACNHGDCASQMPSRSVVQYDDVIDPADGDYNKNNSWTLQTCLTDYDAFSNDGHNCHDDTRLQMANVVYGADNNGYQLWCDDDDGPADISAPPGDLGDYPTADGSSDYGYHYPSQCDYQNSGSCPDSWKTDNDCDCGCTYSDGSHSDSGCA